MNTPWTNNGDGDDGGRLMADQEQEEPAKTRREPDGRFAKGAPSANPRGRPVGSRHKATLAARRFSMAKSSN